MASLNGQDHPGVPVVIESVKIAKNMDVTYCVSPESDPGKYIEIAADSVDPIKATQYWSVTDA